MARDRKSAADRREQALSEAMVVFATNGYVGTAMSQIAAPLGVSQPYMFQLFESKKALFLDCINLCHDLIENLAIESAGDYREQNDSISLAQLGAAYAGLVADRTILQFQLQAWAAACADDDIRELCRHRMSGIIDRVAELTGADPREVDLFFARGALRVVRTAVDLPMPVELDATRDYGGSRVNAKAAAPRVHFQPPSSPGRVPAGRFNGNST